MPAIAIVCVCLGVLWAPAASRSKPPNDPDTRRPGVQYVRITMVQKVPMTGAELDTVREQLSRIWLQAGIVLELTASPSAPSGLRLVFSDAVIHITAPARNVCDLGSIRFRDGAPDPELTVSMTAAREFVREAHPEWLPAIRMLIAARVAGRVAAHELGHYLLAESRHRSTGLMRARFNGGDLIGSHLGAFTPPDRIDLEAGLIRAMGVATR